MLLTIDVGNTNTVLGLFEGEEVVEHWRIATDPVRAADELAGILLGLLGQSAMFADPEITGVALCCTVPSVLHEMREMFRRYYADVPTVIVEPGVKTGVPVRYDNPREVGSDRITNAAAAMPLYGGPAIVVDFGTSTNFDAVSEKGEFVGGALAPGIEISVDALSRRAAQLLKGEPAGPDSVTVIATGGLAPLVIDEVSVIDAYEPWLTLIGLRLTYERNTADLTGPAVGSGVPDKAVTS